MSSDTKLNELGSGFTSSQAFLLEHSSVNIVISTRKQPEAEKAVELCLDS